VSSIQAHLLGDFGSLGGRCEFEFRATAFNPSTLVVVGTETARIIGVECYAYGGQLGQNSVWTGSVPMIPTTIASGWHIDVEVVETDLWPNPDDYFEGPPLLRFGADNGRVFLSGQVITPGPTYCLVGPCSEVKVSFNW
jgi:hypothetical protein